MNTKMKRIVGGLLLTLMLVAGSVVPVFAGEPVDTGKCNAGGGNGSEIVGTTECDPGNSGGRNQGGD